MHFHLILQILSGIIVGWLAGLIVRGRGLGLFLDLVVGALGAFLGAALVHFFDIPVHGFWGALGAAVGCAVILLLFIRLINKE